MTFLGTGNFLAPGRRYWNSFVAEGNGQTVLVEPSPTSLPNLRRAGFTVDQLDVVMISHFHPDHTFGWPFLMLEMLRHGRGTERPVHVVGPPGVEAFLGEMMRLGTVSDIWDARTDQMDIRFVEADPSADRQAAGDLPFRSVEVEHVPELECFGFELGMGLRVGYSGDTKPCAGLNDLASSAQVLVLECNGAHPAKSHMDSASVLALRERHPDLYMVATHLGPEIDAAALPGVYVPIDFEELILGITPRQDHGGPSPVARRSSDGHRVVSDVADG